jgi:hypothetical protein
VFLNPIHKCARDSADVSRKDRRIAEAELSRYRAAQMAAPTMAAMIAVRSVMIKCSNFS